MESVQGAPRRGSDCLAGVSSRCSLAVRFAFCLCLLPPGVFAQPAPATLTFHALPFGGTTAISVIDGAGNVYNTGSNWVFNTPVTPGAAQTQPGGGTCFAMPFFETPCDSVYIAKSDASGNLVFGTLLGGQEEDVGTGLTVDATGNVFVTGFTGGSLPTTPNAASSTNSTNFAAKLSADGSRFIYVTYVPDAWGAAPSIAVDGQGNAYVAGETTASHAYIVKLNPAGSAVLYKVTLGGSAQDWASAVQVDAAGNVYVAGETSSPDFPVTSSAVQKKLAGTQNLFIAKLDPNGNILFSTYLGGSGTDALNALEIDAAGNVYVAGATTSFDFPTTSSAFQPAPIVPLWNSEGPGGFVAKLSSDGSALGYASYVMSTDRPSNSSSLTGVTSLAVTPAGEAYLAGVTGAGFPVTPSAPEICFNGPADAFVVHLDPHGALLDATYAGGGSPYLVEGIAAANDGSVLLQAFAYGYATIAAMRFGASEWSAPGCLSPAVLNAATMSSDGVVAPGEITTLTGLGIGPETGVAYTPDAQGRAPRALAGVQVLFDGQPAPLLYVQSRQINVLAPFELALYTSPTITVQYNNATVGSTRAGVTTGYPGIFRGNLGVSSEAAAVNQDGTINSRSNPAAPGSVVSVWGTGFGSINPPCTTGGLNPPTAVDLDQTVTLEDIKQGNPAAYAGSAPGMLCGVDQINMVVPTYAQGTYLFFPEAGGTEGGVGVTIGCATK
jgi:uncharacterized protein (TIGR03437 family)